MFQKKWWWLAAVLPLAALLGGSVAIVVSGLQDNLQVADVGVVLGNKVRPDGTPSRMLKARLDRAVELYREGYFRLVLVSGGRGKEGYDEPAVMRSYLEAHGVPDEAIFEDNDGYTTWKTAQNTALFLKKYQLKSVVIVSQYYHMPRCRLAFSRFGIEPIYWSRAGFHSIRDVYFFSVAREVAGIIDYYFRRSANDVYLAP